MCAIFHFATARNRKLQDYKEIHRNVLLYYYISDGEVFFTNSPDFVFVKHQHEKVRVALYVRFYGISQ
jgi:hypothetical protein